MLFYIKLPRKSYLLKSAVFGTLIFSSLIGFSQYNPSSKKNITVNDAIASLHSDFGGFLENKGQMADDKGAAVPFVLFRTNIGSTDLFITEKGITYVFNRWFDDVSKFSEEQKAAYEMRKGTSADLNSVERFRVDMHLQGADISAQNITVEEPIDNGRVDYYLAHCPNGIFDVKSYKKITIHNIYPGIDWVFTADAEKGIKHDFVIQPGADASQIKMLYEGAENLVLGKRGGSLKFTTPLGAIEEGALYTYQGGNEVNSKYILNESLVTFKLGNYDKSSPLVIDPPLVLNWATYYGGSSNEGGRGITNDIFGNIFATGFVTSLNFPTFNPGGSHLQAANAGGAAGANGWADAFVVKFNNAGVRQWATYYGGTGDDRGEGVATDNAGNVYVVGGSSSPDMPLQNLAGAYNQITAPVGGSGLHDVMILKFNNAGARLWATYYGGTNKDMGMDVTCDNAGSVYITGFAGCNNFPLTNPGGTAYFQNVYGGGACDNMQISGDAFVLKFNNAGAPVWSTLLGGNGGDVGHGIVVDNAGNIIVAGEAQSTNFPRLNPGAPAFYQNNNAGNGFLWGDVFIAKFGPAYNMLWSTYCGGNYGDNAEDVAVDGAGNIYLTGSTASTNFPLQVLAGSYNQAIHGGPNGQFAYGDAFLIKFSNVGSMLWSTYYGSTSTEKGYSLITDRCDNLYVTGHTQSVAFPTFNPGPGYFYDGVYNGAGYYGNTFLLGFDKNGVQNWGTHYGTGGVGHHITVDQKGKVTIAGEAWGSGFTLANPGGGAYYDASYNGNPNDLLIARFAPIPINLSVFNQTNVTCFGLLNGTASVTPSGGVPPYTYSWNTVPSQTTSMATGLSAGTYSVTVFDANCSIDTLSFIITEPALLQAFIPVQTNQTCYGGSTGGAMATQLGGTSPYTYAWSGTAQTGQTVSNLSAGTFTVTISDNNGCTAQASVTLTEPPLLTASITAQSNVLCNGENNGSATVTAGGGTGAYTYNWNVGGTNNVASSLTAGSYTVTVSDANGCTAEAIATITEPLALALNSNATPTFCSQSIGTANAIANGGTGAYTYSWSTAPAQLTQQATGLAAGTYSFLVTDANGCSAQSSVLVPDQSPDTFQLVIVNPALCFGSCDGSATLQLSGNGNGPYNYAWNTLPAQNTLTATGLCAGVYTCTVTDGNGCSDTMSVSITQPTLLTATVNATPVSCFGGSDGTATVQASGGTVQYLYAWDDGQTTTVATGVSAGLFSCTVTDNNGCTAVASVNVTEPPQLIVNTTPSFSICDGQNANVTASVLGGTPAYLYNWSSGQAVSSVTVSPIAETIYSVTVTDANGCTAESATTVSVNPLPDVSFSADVVQGCGPLCVTFTNNTLNTTNAMWMFGDGASAGGSPNASHCYNNTGVYSVTLTVTDVNGCVADAVIPNYINVYPKPLASFTATPQPATILSPNIYFTDLSTGATAWSWSFGDVATSSSTLQNPNFIYPDTGVYAVQLIVVNEFGCSDTANNEIKIDPDFIMYVPNTFTPNGDGKNEFFIPVGIGMDSEYYELLIFDRWGDLIFKSNNPNVGWNGKANNGADFAQEDTYVWKINMRDVLGGRHRFVGHVNLIR